MNWTDIYDIAISLEETHPDTDIKNIKFTTLMSMILELNGFVGEPKHCNEKILEAVQMAWMDERK